MNKINIALPKGRLLKKEKWIKLVLIILLNIIVIGLYFIVFVSPTIFNFLTIK